MRNSSSRLGTIILIVAAIAVVVIATMMSGARLGLWEPIFGYILVRTYMSPIAYGVIALGALVFASQLFTKNNAGAVKAFTASLIGVCLLIPVISGAIQTNKPPPIHDITTDTINPPEFEVLNDQRSGARNTLVYGGDEIAAVQNFAYPNIKPIRSELSPNDAFNKALRVADYMGWEIVSEDADKLRFEATARTVVYTFLDDVVVVITPEEYGSRVDIRSVSRVGRGDKGVNAARIGEFIQNFGRL